MKVLPEIVVNYMKREISIEKHQSYVNDVPGGISYRVYLKSDETYSGSPVIYLSPEEVQELILRLSEAVK